MHGTVTFSSSDITDHGDFAQLRFWANRCLYAVAPAHPRG